MISIRKYKFNFINVPKNASTSIRRFFIDNVVGPEDRYTAYYNTPTDHWSQGMGVHAPHSHMDVEYAVEHGLIDLNETIVGVIREPFERVLSLYLYRAKQGLISNPSVQHFRESVMSGYYPDTLWQNQEQHTFLEYQGKQVGTWWLFDNIQKHINQFVETYGVEVKEPLKWQNKSINGHDTKEFVDRFYNEDTRNAVNKYYEQDIELYNRIKNASTY
jgi:hypothetical protein